MSERDTAGNRRLARWTSTDDPDPNPGAERAGVDHDRGADERPDHVEAGSDSGAVDGGETSCEECGATAEYDDASAALGTDAVPAKPLCSACIFQYA